MPRIIIPGKGNGKAHFFVSPLEKQNAENIFETIANGLGALITKQEWPDEKKAEAFWSTINGLRACLDDKWVRTFENTVSKVIADARRAQDKDEGTGET